MKLNKKSPSQQAGGHFLSLKLGMTNHSKLQCIVPSLSNKKADEKLLSIYLFIIYIIVLTGIISGVLLFYGSPLDVRELEADILSSKIIDCLTEQGNLKIEVLNDKFNIVENCNLYLKDNIAGNKEEPYAIKVSLFNFDSCSNGNQISCSENIKEISAGRNDYFEYCKIEQNAEAKKFPKCSEKQVYILNQDKKILIDVLGVVGKIGKNGKNA